MIMIIFTVPEENGKKVLTMTEYIEREAVVRELNKTYDNMNAMGAQFYGGFMNAVYRIKDFPVADVAPVRHARWVDNHCTACGMMPMGDEMWKLCDFEPPRFEKFMDYCPSCGAKMDGGAGNGC